MDTVYGIPVQSFTNKYVTIAEAAMEGLVESGIPGSSFYVRDDSYTDKNTGITHVHVRQTMYGFEVADGDMNINIKDGKVLSYGDSVRDPFTRGNICGR